MVLSDNLGKILAGHFRPVSSSIINVGGIKATDGIEYTMSIYTPSSNNWANLGGKFIRIGEGSTPATAQDFELEDPFSNAPESGRVSSSLATYIDGSGKVNQASQFQPMGGNGSISEVVQQLDMKDSGGVTREVQISRIIVDPAIAFLINGQVNLDNEVSL